MPLDDEIIEENPVEGEENPADNPSVYPSDSPDPEIGGNDSLVQDEEELGSNSPGIENLEPDVLPEGEDTENVEEGMDSVEDLDILDEILDQNHEDDYLLDDDYYSSEEEIMNYSMENIEVYTDLEAFESSTIQVDLYQYTILNRLEFMQYALCIVIALLFLQIFVRYKK